MGKKHQTITILAFTFIVFLPQHIFAQQKQISRPKFDEPILSFFISGSYFTPKFTDVDAVYQTIEKNYSLPQGKNFTTPYFVTAGVRFSPVPGQSIQAEIGGSILKAPQESTTNFLQLYYTGISYLVSIPLPVVSIYLGGGPGYNWLNTQRTYETTLGVAQVNSQLAELHGIGGIEFLDPSGVSIALEARYTYGITIFPKRSDLDFVQKGITGGIRIGVPILL